jgi:hypothetical protein
MPQSAPARAIVHALPIETRQDVDHAVFAWTHIGILSIDERVTRAYFNFVDAGRDVQSLQVVGRRCLSSLHAIYEYERTRRGAGHDDLGRVRHLRFP